MRFLFSQRHLQNHLRDHSSTPRGFPRAGMWNGPAYQYLSDDIGLYPWYHPCAVCTFGFLYLPFGPVLICVSPPDRTAKADILADTSSSSTSHVTTHPFLRVGSPLRHLRKPPATFANAFYYSRSKDDQSGSFRNMADGHT